MMRFLLFVALGVALLPCPKVAAGGPDEASAPSIVELTGTRPVLIQAPDHGGDRVLLDFPNLEQLSGKTVVSARILLPHIPVSAPLSLEVKVLSRAWNAASATWSFPWERPGGDFSDELRGSDRVTPDREVSRPVGFDVSTSIRAIAEGRATSCGFLLMTVRNYAGDEGADRALPGAAARALVEGGPIRLIVTCASES